MPKVPTNHGRSRISPPRFSSLSKTGAESEVIKRSSKPIDKQQRTSEQKRQRDESEGRQRKKESRTSNTGSKQRQAEANPASSTERGPAVSDNSNARKLKLFSIFEAKATQLGKNSEKTRGAIDSRTHARKQDSKSQDENDGPAPRLTPFEKERAHASSNSAPKLSQDGEDESRDKFYDIITTTNVSKTVDNVPKTAQEVQDPAELRRLLRQINLAELPR